MSDEVELAWLERLTLGSMAALVLAPGIVYMKFHLLPLSTARLDGKDG